MKLILMNIIYEEHRIYDRTIRNPQMNIIYIYDNYFQRLPWGPEDNEHKILTKFTQISLNLAKM